MIRSRFIYALLTLVIVFYFAPANAQNKTTTKNKKATTVKKPAEKPKTAAKKPKVSSAAQDTTKKSAQGQANKNANQGGLSEEVVVTTAYKPVLADAVKIRRNPDLEDKTPFKAPLTYFPLDKRLERNTDIHQLQAMQMPKEQDSVPSNNYARIGVGNMKTTFGEVYINNGQDQALQVGGFGKHIAQSGSIPKQNESRDEAGVFIKGIVDDNDIIARIGYNRRATYFYGFDPSNPPQAYSPLAQHFNTITGTVELTKKFKDEQNAFTYAAKIDGYLWNNAFATKENNIVLSGFVNQTVKQFYAGLGASLDMSSQKDSAYSINNNLVRLNPYLKFQGDNYKIDVGLNLVRGFGNSTKAYIFPAAKLEFQVIPKYVRLFAEVKGDVNKTSLHDLAEENPFIENNIPIQNSVDRLDLAAGLKGTVAPGVGFKFTVFRNRVKNMPLLLLDSNSYNHNQFGVVYDNGTATITGVNGELDVKVSDEVNVFGRVEYKDYKMASEAEPWNLPKFKLTAGTQLHITKQLSINGTLLFRGSTYDRTTPVVITNGNSTTTTFQLVQISSFANLSGGVEYKINNTFSIFGQVNNILNNNPQVWRNYQAYGFNIFGGVGAHF
ncbi:TonB-dependent receptor [Mucilaginibacter sp. BT774]|uniref:TonB-dependent receptor n=1 Tax=Mucilaginibacter sp. BT774 TaxID=3062276 RepID=UPI0026761991|nr:TonB-dependent receptor [Mucilaginibacter sp. BT774]MDO3624900.1 TonB-dependent receptor [Mucilaginibacter sp. BT774]